MCMHVPCMHMCFVSRVMIKLFMVYADVSVLYVIIYRAPNVCISLHLQKKRFHVLIVHSNFVIDLFCYFLILYYEKLRLKYFYVATLDNS